MKKTFLILVIYLAITDSIAQNVGIGTSTPNATAQLDVASSNKGMLIPRMTSTNRAFIINPANGLMVFDTTSNRLYQYQDGNWRYFINNTYWTQSSTHNWTYNSGDSIGIGTTTPTEWLDVDGNIRSRNNLIADNDIRATGDVIAGNIVTTGNMVVSGVSALNGNVTANSNLNVDGSSLLNGNVTANSDLIINNNTATLQLKTDGDNKGYFQLSGSNVRMGTNSGNLLGALIIRMNGSDRVIINANGDITLDGKLRRSSASSFSDFIPVCGGRIDANGTIYSGTGNFTVTRTGTGKYEIYSSEIAPVSSILITPMVAISSPCRGYYTTGGKMEVVGPADFSFFFAIYTFN